VHVRIRSNAPWSSHCRHLKRVLNEGSRCPCRETRVLKLTGAFIGSCWFVLPVGRLLLTRRPAPSAAHEPFGVGMRRWSKSARPNLGWTASMEGCTCPRSRSGQRGPGPGPGVLFFYERVTVSADSTNHQTLRGRNNVHLSFSLPLSHSILLSESAPFPEGHIVTFNWVRGSKRQ